MSRPFDRRRRARTYSSPEALIDRLPKSLDLKFAQNKRLPPNVTFSRAGGATVTDLDGTLRWADENLLLQAKDFSTTWSADGDAVVTTNQIAGPDGVVDADLLTASAGGPNRVSQFLPSAIQGTLSPIVCAIKVKQNDATHINLRIFEANSGVDAFGDFEFASETFENTQQVDSTSVENLGGGWFKIAIFATLTSTGSISCRCGGELLSSSTGTKTYIVDAQVNRGTVLHDFSVNGMATTTAAFYGPRFDHVYNGTTWVSKGLKREPARTNKGLQSRALDTGANWKLINVDVPTTNNASPNGDSDADEVAATSTADQQLAIYQDFTGLTAGQNTAVSAHVHLGTNALFAQLAWDSDGSGGDGCFCNFNLTTGEVGTVTAMTAGTATDATAINIGNGYWLFTTVGKIASGTIGRFTIGIVDRIDAAKFEAADLADNDSIIATDTQVEANVTFSSSRIPTTTASATRAVEVVTMTLADQTAGTFYIEGYTPHLQGEDAVILSANDGGTTDAIDILVSSANKLKATTVNSADTNGSVEAVGTITAGVSYKASFMFADDDIALSADGAASVTDNTAALPLTDAVTTLDLGADGSGANGASMIIGRVTIFPTRLSNAQGEALP